MHGLYLSNLDPRKSIGYKSKIVGQINGFCRLGCEMDLIVFNETDQIVLTSYKKDLDFTSSIRKISAIAGKNLFTRRYKLFKVAIEHIRVCNPKFIYLRYPRSEPLYLFFLFRLKTQFPRLLILCEYPTYPYDQEYNTSIFTKDKIVFFLDKLTRNYLNYFVHQVVSINYSSSIFGIPTISIDNGVDIQSFPATCNSNISSEINMICVANVSSWHGYDRVLRGLGQYYKYPQSSDCRITFHIVGVQDPYMSILKKLVDEQAVAHAVTFYPPMQGKPLDDLFHHCHLAIGVLGGHRKGLEVMSPLKNREYCARGIPFVLGHIDPDFPQSFQYSLQVNSDETPIDIRNIVEFIRGLSNESDIASKMRAYAYETLDWSVKLEPVKVYIDENVRQLSCRNV